MPMPRIHRLVGFGLAILASQEITDDSTRGEKHNSRED
jgi:hypothetical protein